MKYLSLSIPGYGPIDAPPEIPGGGTDTLSTSLSSGIVIFIVLAVVLSLITFIRGGMEWAGSGGDKTKIEQARKRITFGVLGLVLTIGSFFLVNFVFQLFNLKLLGAP